MEIHWHEGSGSRVNLGTHPLVVDLIDCFGRALDFSITLPVHVGHVRIDGGSRFLALLEGAVAVTAPTRREREKGKQSVMGRGLINMHGNVK